MDVSQHLVPCRQFMLGNGGLEGRMANKPQPVSGLKRNYKTVLASPPAPVLALHIQGKRQH